MADHTNDHTTYVERDRVERVRGEGSSGLAFIVGGLVVAVIVLVVLFGGFFETDGGSTSVTIESTETAPAAPAADPAPADVAPATEAAPADAN